MSAHQKAAIEKLQRGEIVSEYKEGGNSMVPLIYSQQPVTLAPVNADLLEKGDIVLVKVRGKIYTHKVLALRGDEVQIGNNRGGVNGWTNKSNVYGIVTHVDGVARGKAIAKIKS